MPLASMGDSSALTKADSPGLSTSCCSPLLSAAILFCVEGEAVVSKGDERLVLKPGESAFIAASDSPVNVSGVGRLARVYNKL